MVLTPTIVVLKLKEFFLKDPKRLLAICLLASQNTQKKQRRQAKILSAKQG